MKNAQCSVSYGSGPTSEALIRMVIEAFLIRNLYHAEKHEKEKRENCGLFCNEFPSLFLLRHHLTFGTLPGRKRS